MTERGILLFSSIALALAVVSPLAPRASPTSLDGDAKDLARRFGLEIHGPVPDGVSVLVVDAASGKPVEGALVVSVDEQEFTCVEESREGVPLDGAGALREYGVAYSTSDDGRTRIRAAAAPRTLIALHGDAFGRATLEVHDRVEQSIPIARRELVVDVAEPDGSPAQRVPVMLGECAFERGTPGSWRAITGADGQVRIPALELERAIHRSCGREALVMLGCACRGDALRAIDAALLEPLRFTLPATGSLEVELEDVEGKSLRRQLVPERIRLDVDGWTQGDAFGLSRCTDAKSINSLFFHSTDGHFLLDHVQLGLKLTLTVESERFEFERTEIDGPTKPGEVKHVTLRAGDDGDESISDASDPTAIEDREEPLVKEPEPDDDDVSSSAAVSVLCDVPIEPCTLYAQGTPEAEVGETFHGALARVFETPDWIDVNGRATATGFPEGDWSVAVVLASKDLRAENVVLAVVPGIHVGESQHLRDPRLQQIDLRGKLRRRHLEVVDEKGTPLDGRIVFEPREGSTCREEFRFQDGVCEFVTAASDRRCAFVAVDRFRPFALDPKGASGMTRIVMKRGIPIRVVLEPRLKPREEEERLYVGIPERPRCGAEPDEKAENDCLRTIELAPGASATFDVPEPGDWRVMFLCTNGDTYEVRAACDREIHVEDRPDEQLFTVAPIWFLRQLDEESNEADAPHGK
jgi:hypothetical protein